MIDLGHYAAGGNAHTRKNVVGYLVTKTVTGLTVTGLRGGSK